MNKQQLISVKPTVVQRLSSITPSSSILSGQSPPASVEFVRPFLKDAEKGSVFNRYHVHQDLNILRIALGEFNKDADTAVITNSWEAVRKISLI